MTGSLVKAAMACLRVAPWHYLEECDSILLGYPDGRQGCAFVDPLEDDSPYLALYMDGNALASLQRMHRMTALDDGFRILSASSRLENIECAFVPPDELGDEDRQALSDAGIVLAADALYPRFRVSRLFEMPAPLQDADSISRLRTALLAFARIGERFRQVSPDPDNALDAESDQALGTVYDELGFLEEEMVPLLTVAPVSLDGFAWSRAHIPEESRVNLTVPAFKEDSALMATLSALPVGRHELYCELFALSDPPEDGYFYAVTLLILRARPSYAAVPMADRFGPDQHELLSGLAHALMDMKARPRRLAVRDDITYLFLRSFCKSVGIPLTLRKEIPALKLAFDEMVAIEADDT